MSHHIHGATLAFLIALLDHKQPPSSLKHHDPEAVTQHGWSHEDLEPIPESELGGEA